MEGFELISFQIIAAVGTARSMYMEALQRAKDGNIDLAKQMIADADEAYSRGHEVHMQILTMQAQGEEIPYNLLLNHAEDQMMCAEIVKMLVEELIEIYQLQKEKGV